MSTQRQRAAPAAVTASTTAPTGKAGRRNASLANLRPWKPGQSGNPRGRGAEQDKLRSLCRTYTPEAVATLADIMRNRRAPAAARIHAAAELLNRAHGRPPSALELNVKTPPAPRGLTPERVREIRTLVLGIDLEADAPPPPPGLPAPGGLPSQS